MPKKILVADDSATIQRAVKIALSDEDVTLYAVRKAAEVLAQAHEIAPDAILLDNQFHQDNAPDGYALCAAIKQDPALSHIPIAFLASHSYDKASGEEAGAVLFFEKPFESKTLIDGVSKLLEFASVSSGMLPAVDEPEPPAMSLFAEEEDEDGGETVINSSYTPPPTTTPAPALTPRSSIAQAVHRETTAMPTFNPVAFGSLLGDESSSAPPVAEEPPKPSSPPLFSTAASSPAEQLSESFEEPPPISFATPPPFPGSAPPEAPPSFTAPNAGVLTPPPLDAAPPSPPPLSFPSEEDDFPEPPRAFSPSPSPFGTSAPAFEEPAFEEPAFEAPSYDEPAYEEPAYEEPSFEAPSFDESSYDEPAYEEPAYDEPPKPRQKPLIIPAPSDGPREFPVKDLLSPPRAAEPDDDFVMEPPVFIEQQAQHFEEPDTEERTVVEYVPSAAMIEEEVIVTTVTDTITQTSHLPALAASAGLKAPTFALNPNEDYLARALEGSRRTSLRHNRAGASVQVQAVQELAGETIERIAWEVVPELAELIIREMIERQS